MSNLTPQQIEEFEATFKHFDKDASNTLNRHEFKAAIGSLGIAQVKFLLYVGGFQS